MKIAYEKMENVIEIGSDHVSSLVIENTGFMYRLLEDFRITLNGEECGVVFSESDTPVQGSKAVSMITDFIGFSLNQKSLLTRIISELEKTANEGVYYHTSQELLAYIENYIMELTLHVSCELSCEKLNMQNLLKSVGISIVDDYDSLEERLLAYMDLARDHEKKKLFIFVNLRSLVSYENLELMMNTAIEREHRILLIDNVEYPRLRNEKRLIIDADLCEI